ncbi:MAG: hypothetical protein IKW31_00550 [Alistipes sp.]|nr:hypothetical protein [Alistipes sp.]
MAIERRRGLFGALMLAVLLFNVMATTLFVHSHNIEGREFFHSHPYNPASAHSHTRGHILLLNDAPIHDALVAESVTCCELLSTEITSQYMEHDASIIEQTSLSYSLRGPPAKA